MLDRTIHTLHIPQNVDRGPGVLLRVFVAHGMTFASGSLFECLADELTFPLLEPLQHQTRFLFPNNSTPCASIFCCSSATSSRPLDHALPLHDSGS